MFIKIGYTLYLILLWLLISFAFVAIFTLLSGIYVPFKAFCSVISVLNSLPDITLLPLGILLFGKSNDFICDSTFYYLARAALVAS